MSPLRIATLAVCLIALLAASARAQFDEDPVVTSLKVNPESAKPGDEVTIELTVDVSPLPDSEGEHWHIYPRAEEHTGVEIATTLTATRAASELAIGDVQWPKPQTITNAVGESQAVYEGSNVFKVPVKINADAPAGNYEVTLAFGYQTCASLCLPPQTKKLKATIHVAGAAPAPPPTPGQTTEIPSPTTAGDTPPIPPATKAESSDEYFKANIFGLELAVPKQGWLGNLAILLMALVGGFLLNLTPCVLPIIPIKIMGLTQSAGDRRRSTLLGIMMGIGILAFWLAIGGAISFLSGFDNISSLFQQPWFGIGVGVFIAVMGIGMLGAFTVQLPQTVYLINPKHDSVHGAFLFGVMTAVLSTPCTAPFMGSAAAWATQKNDAALVLSTFAAIAVGMAAPYVVLSAFPKLVERVPRTGPASELIKQVMGLLMFAVAAFFGGTGLLGLLKQHPYLGSVLYWWVATFFVGLTALWLAYRTFQITHSWPKRFTFTVLGLLMLLGMVWWSASETATKRLHHQRDLAAAQQRDAQISRLLEWARSGTAGPLPDGLADIKMPPWRPYDPNAYAAAKRNKMITIVNFTADWWLNCHALENKFLFSERVDSLVRESDNIATFKADITSGTGPAKQYLAELGATGIPLIVVDGPGLEEPLQSSFYTADSLIEMINKATIPHDVPP